MIKDYTSVVLCTYNRAHLLKRSLVCYEKQTMTDFELIILDDNSQDETEELVKSYMDKINIKYIKLEDKKPDEWRDAGCIINRGIKMTEGEYIYATHPEVMPCFDCLEKMNEVMEENPGAYLNCRTYYLTSVMQEQLDNVDWQTDFYEVRQIPGFYEVYELNDFMFYDKDEFCDMLNKYFKKDYEEFAYPFTTLMAEVAEVWDSWVFGGMTRPAWKDMGGLNEYRVWGTVDIDFMHRRRNLGIPTISPEGIYVIHQNHDRAVGKFTPTKRNLEVTLNREFAQGDYNKRLNFLDDMEV